MTSPHEKNWAKLRFEWKRRVNRDRRLGRGAKQLASYLCDTCVNRNTGRFWHRNETIAVAFSVNVRTVQRNLRELRERGWLTKVRVTGKRRAFEISMPGGTENPVEHDNCDLANTTCASPEHDKSVVPYSNQRLNQGGTQRNTEVLFSTVSINSAEVDVLARWEGWLAEQSRFCPKHALDCVKYENGYELPARFPREEDATKYAQYFDAMVEKHGAFI